MEDKNYYIESKPMYFKKKGECIVYKDDQTIDEFVDPLWRESCPNMHLIFSMIDIVKNYIEFNNEQYKHQHS